MFIHQYPTRNGDKLQQIGRFILAWSCASPPPVLKAVSSSQSITFSTLTQPTQSHDLNQQPSVRSDSQSLLQQQQLINTSDNQYLSFRRPLVDDSVVGGGIKRERKKKAKIPKYPLQQRSRPEKSVTVKRLSMDELEYIATSSLPEEMSEWPKNLQRHEITNRKREEMRRLYLLEAKMKREAYVEAKRQERVEQGLPAMPVRQLSEWAQLNVAKREQAAQAKVSEAMAMDDSEPLLMNEKGMNKPTIDHEDEGKSVEGSRLTEDGELEVEPTRTNFDSLLRRAVERRESIEVVSVEKRRAEKKLQLRKKMLKLKEEGLRAKTEEALGVEEGTSQVGQKEEMSEKKEGQNDGLDHSNVAPVTMKDNDSKVQDHSNNNEERTVMRRMSGRENEALATEGESERALGMEMKQYDGDSGQTEVSGEVAHQSASLEMKKKNKNKNKNKKRSKKPDAQVLGDGQSQQQQQQQQQQQHQETMSSSSLSPSSSPTTSTTSSPTTRVSSQSSSLSSSSSSSLSTTLLSAKDVEVYGRTEEETARLTECLRWLDHDDPHMIESTVLPENHIAQRDELRRRCLLMLAAALTPHEYSRFLALFRRFRARTKQIADAAHEAALVATAEFASRHAQSVAQQLTARGSHASSSSITTSTTTDTTPTSSPTKSLAEETGSSLDVIGSTTLAEEGEGKSLAETLKDIERRRKNTIQQAALGFYKAVSRVLKNNAGEFISMIARHLRHFTVRELEAARDRGPGANMVKYSAGFLRDPPLVSNESGVDVPAPPQAYVDVEIATDLDSPYLWRRLEDLEKSAYKVALHNIPATATTRELMHALGKCGTVLAVEVFRVRLGDVVEQETAKKDKRTHALLVEETSPVFGFVYMQTEAGRQALLHRAVQIFGMCIHDVMVYTRPIDTRTKLFTSGFKHKMTHADVTLALRALLAADGLESKLSSVWMPYNHKTGRNKGFAFVEFTDHFSAAKASRVLRGVPLQFVWPRTPANELTVEISRRLTRANAVLAAVEQQISQGLTPTIPLSEAKAFVDDAHSDLMRALENNTRSGSLAGAQPRLLTVGWPSEGRRANTPPAPSYPRLQFFPVSMASQTSTSTDPSSTLISPSAVTSSHQSTLDSSSIPSPSSSPLSPTLPAFGEEKKRNSPLSNAMAC